MWELDWPTNRGTDACAGVGTKSSSLHAYGYCPLLGLDDQSWGWNLGTRELQHNGETNLKGHTSVLFFYRVSVLVLQMLHGDGHSNEQS